MGVGIPNPLHEREWTDESGAIWRMRGVDVLSVKRARQLFRSPDVLLVHLYDGDAHVHTGPDRDGLVEEIEQVWRGEDDQMHRFEVGEFRNVEHREIVFVVEDC